MTLKEAKMLADKINKGLSIFAYTRADRAEAFQLLKKTNHGIKTQKAWDRLKKRLDALG